MAEHLSLPLVYISCILSLAIGLYFLYSACLTSLYDHPFLLSAAETAESIITGEGEGVRPSQDAFLEASREHASICDGSNAGFCGGAR